MDDLHRLPSELDINDLDAPLVAAFLDYLQVERLNSVRTRNARLAAIGSFFGYAGLHHPEQAASIRRVLAIPPKRFERNLVTFLTPLDQAQRSKVGIIPVSALARTMPMSA